jgi:hypothetical protein
MTNPELNSPDQTPLSLTDIAKKHDLNAQETGLFITNISLVSQGIVEYFTSPDPEDGLETLDVWLGTLDMYTSMSPKIASAIAEAVEVFLKKSEPTKKKRKRHR